MSKLFFHSTTKARIERLLLELPQSLLISGPSGIGLSGVVEYFCKELGVTPQIVLPEKDEKVDIEKGTISVDIIRRLYAMTRTIETGKRVIVIDYAERMGVQAQNAFLKLLEEPGKNTYFVLLSHEPGSLLPTIRSRTQSFEVRLITQQQSEELLAELKIEDGQLKAQLLFMAKGLPAELTRLVTDNKYFEARSQIVRDARQFLQGSAYDRLTVALKYKDDRSGALTLLSDAMNQVRMNITSGRVELLPKIDLLLRAYDRIRANGNVRLQLAAAMV